MRYQYKPKGVCPISLEFDLDGDKESNKVSNIVFQGGCNGNLKAISKLVDGWSVDQIEEALKGNTCGNNSTSCADQLAIAVRDALEKSQ